MGDTALFALFCGSNIENVEGVRNVFDDCLLSGMLRTSCTGKADQLGGLLIYDGRSTGRVLVV